MKVTNIQQQVKRKDRYSIYIDGKYTFSLGENELLQSSLRKNQDVTAVEVEQLKDQSELRKLYEKTLNLLSYRPRTEWELQDYLIRQQLDPEVISKILNMLSEHGYIDDKQVAARWVKSRRLLKPISQRRLRAELKQKRVSNETIDEVLSSDETDELVVLRKLVERKAKRYPDRQKLMQYLARQGYNYDDIRIILSEMD